MVIHSSGWYFLDTTQQHLRFGVAAGMVHLATNNIHM